MPQSLSRINLHLVFSTKGRAPMLQAGVAEQLHAYLAGIARNKKCMVQGIGGAADHVHLLLQLDRALSVADRVRDLKSNSSSWMRERQAAFGWQTGYGVFSFGHDDLPRLQAYVRSQEEHHRTVGFQDEFRRFLTEHGLEWDERYVWD